MIYPDSQRAIERSGEHRPKRLRRDDVASMRTLYASGMANQEGNRWTTWKGGTTIWLPRERIYRAAAKLGKPTPGVAIEAKWTVRHVLGLDVIVTAHRSLGGPHNFKLKVAEHRFRGTTSETQFCREVSHAVRLGLGWLIWREEAQNG